jgi:hypothetical protein
LKPVEGGQKSKVKNQKSVFEESNFIEIFKIRWVHLLIFDF